MTGGKIVVLAARGAGGGGVGGVVRVVDSAGWVRGDVLASRVCYELGGGRVAGRCLCRRLELEAGARVEGGVGVGEGVIRIMFEVLARRKCRPFGPRPSRTQLPRGLSFSAPAT